MKKKILSMVMAGAMVLSVCSVSQATEISKNTDGKYAAGEITVGGEYVVPTIDVTLSDTGSSKIAINPYGLGTTSVVSGLSGDDATAQLANKVETITNASAVALAVNATVIAEPATNSKATLATAALKDTETKNAIFAYLQVDKGAAADFSAKEYDTKANTNQVLFGTKATTKKAIVTLDKGTGSDKVASYKILGQVAPNPTALWTSDDKVNFKITFDFEPRG